MVTRRFLTKWLDNQPFSNFSFDKKICVILKSSKPSLVALSRYQYHHTSIGCGWKVCDFGSPSHTNTSHSIFKYIIHSIKSIMISQLLTLTLFPLISATIPSSFLHDVVQDHVCPGGTFSCAGDQPCCAFAPKEEGCCSGGSIESCCADDTGGVCCLSQPTLCIPKNINLPYPARCCPRETVGCSAGTVGCCNPARAWQRGPPINPPSFIHQVHVLVTKAQTVSFGFLPKHAGDSNHKWN